MLALKFYSINATKKDIARILKRQLNSGNHQICIVGGGPAGFYAAQQIVKLLPSARVDVYERLPVPFGLVRFGVAPDHPEVKNVINTFTKTAKHSNVNYYGNVTLGAHVCLQDLRDAYHAVILSYGAEEDRRLGVPGEDSENVVAARRFVGWYNGLPADRDLDLNLDCESVAVIGQGNVAVDVARILLSPVDKLKETDITEYALEKLSRSKVKEVNLIGRRGPMQVAFTIKELRELLVLPDVETIFDRQDFKGIPELIPALGRPRKRLTELLCKAALERAVGNGSKKLRFIFKRSPLIVVGKWADRVEGLQMAINRLEGADWQSEKAVQTEHKETTKCGLVLRSIGYKSVQADSSLPFDTKKGVALNDEGYIAEGVYCCGWLSTGPVGVILSTMTNAFGTAQLLHKHIQDGTLDCSMLKPGSEQILAQVRSKGGQVVNFEDWERIDDEEQRRGRERGKPREKIVDINEMLSIAKS